MKAKITFKNIKAYIQGTWRSKFMYTEFEWLLPKHISEQIRIRIKSMEKACYTEGNCQLCGCVTSALQMANKACDKPCYPSMVGYYRWTIFKRGGLFYDSETEKFWSIRDNKFLMLNL